jgi:hypothetical protein
MGSVPGGTDEASPELGPVPKKSLPQKESPVPKKGLVVCWSRSGDLSQKGAPQNGQFGPMGNLDLSPKENPEGARRATGWGPVPNGQLARTEV